MKVLYVTLALGHGRGGHFHSLAHLVSAMTGTVEPAILTLGPGGSSVLAEHAAFRGHLPFDGRALPTLLASFNRRLEEEGTELVHFFDELSFSLLSPLARLGRRPVVLSKCGGPNPRRYPVPPALILFSRENLDWFAARRRFQGTRLALIPNRVLDEAPPRVAALPLPPDGFRLMRIGRVTSYYRDSILSSLRLAHSLAGPGMPVIRLVVVGAVESQALRTELLDEASKRGVSLTLVSEEPWIRRAASCLHEADAVIGTGRGFMEAAALGKPLLTPCLDDELPVLVTEVEYPQVFATNFSERNRLVGHDRSANRERLVRLVTDAEWRAGLGRTARTWFEQDFYVEAAPPRYLELYRQAGPMAGRSWRNLPFLVRALRRVRAAGIQARSAGISESGSS